MLVEKAEVVAVVDIFEIDDDGPASVNVDGRAVLASAYLRVLRRNPATPLPALDFFVIVQS
jgi:hypothetical protein